MRYRFHAVNALLAALAVACAGGVAALLPGVPWPARLLAAGGAALLVGVIALVAWNAVSRDMRRYGMYLAYRGWHFQAEGPEYARRFTVFPFGSGLGGRAVNVLRGTHRFYDCATFTYIVNRPAPQFYQVVVLELGAEVPTVQMLPEDLWAAVRKALGGQDIQVGHPAFDDHWRLVSEDPAFVQRLVTSALARWLSGRSTRGMPLALESGAVLTWEAGPRGVARLSRRLDALVAVAQAIPEDQWRRAGRAS